MNVTTQDRIYSSATTICTGIYYNRIEIGILVFANVRRYVMSKLVKATVWTAFALALGLTFGCSSNSSVADDALATANAAKAAAAAADDAAADADSKATEALILAKQAVEKANKAYGVARAAEFQSNRNGQKIERMFKKSMYK